MSGLEVPVDLYMSTPVHQVDPKEDLNHVYSRLTELKVSNLAVVENEKDLVGVISRGDLLRVGRHQAGTRGPASLLTLPNQEAFRHMSAVVVTVGPQDTISTASRRMRDARIHRVYVKDGDDLVGVLSTRDVMLAIRDKQLRTPINQWMSSPVFSVRHDDPISLATDRLHKAHVSGLIVVEDGWPVGLFTQREALEARDVRRDTPVESVMSSAMLILEESTPINRAAAQAAACQVRRVIAMKSSRIAGILTGLDFARAAI